MLNLIFLLYLCHATWFSVKNQTTSLTKWTQATKQTRVNWICGIIASLFLKHTITIKKVCHCHCNLADVWNIPLCTLEDILGPLLGILKLLYFRMDTFTPASLLRPDALGPLVIPLPSGFFLVPPFPLRRHSACPRARRSLPCARWGKEGVGCHTGPNLDGPWVAHECRCACLVPHC
jgi:hypothetical protein